MPGQHYLPAPPTFISSHNCGWHLCSKMATASLSRCLLVVVFAALLHHQVSSLMCSPLPYEIYWNVADADPQGIDISAYGIFPANFTQTGNSCSNPGCKAWTQGVFPTISSEGHIVNGGVPQKANLTEHQMVLTRDVVGWIPDPDWSGNAVLDFESWTTVWELNTGGGDWHSVRYPKYSLELEEQEHPDWDTVELYLSARNNFNISALGFFAQTLNTLSTLRPKAKWGFYGLPMNFNGLCEGTGASMKCGYDSVMGNIYRGFSDEQNLIWAASTALYPSIYLPPGKTVDENAAYVRSVINETVRKAGGRIPVYGFHWNYYHDGKSLLNMQDLQSGLLGPYDVGARGVVIWGSSSESKKPEFLTYVKDHVGPMALNFMEQMCNCSQTHCNGHGRCMPSSSTHCECYPGYSGTNCEKTNKSGLEH